MAIADLYSMASLGEPGTPRAQTTIVTGMPSATDIHSSTYMFSSTHTPSIPAGTNTPPAADKPSMPEKPPTTDDSSTSIIPLIHGITLNDKHTPTESPSPRWHRAAHAALSTNGLLCSIIAHLPLEDVIAATGICRSWRDAIAADTTLQQVMFLKPVELSEVLVETRQLLALAESETISIDECAVVGRLNPFAEKLCGSIKFRAAQSRKLPLPDHRWWGCDREPPAVFGDPHPKGIWRSMFITQPPCTRVHVEIFELRIEDIYGRSKGNDGTMTVVEQVNGDDGFNLERGNGVKLGDLYGHIHAHLSCGDSPSVRTTVSKYVTEYANLPDRTLCIARNGKACLPEQPSDLPDVNCDAFGGNFDYSSTRGSWFFVDMQEHWPESHYERFGLERRDSSVKGGGGKQKDDGELDDECDRDKDEYGRDIYFDHDGRRLPPRKTRVNVYVP